MNLTAYDLNIQYQRTQLNYEMTFSKVDPNETSSEILEGKQGINQDNLPVVYMSEENLNNQEMLSKILLEATYSQYSQTSSSATLFPNISTSNSDEIPKEIQAYTQGIPEGIEYTSSSEYYEKTTLDFSGTITIVTPQGEYNIDLNLSYTQEFYEKNASFVEIANEKLQAPLLIELDEDNDSLKNLNSINLIFENMIEEDTNTKDFFERLLASLEQKEEYIQTLKEENEEKKMDNYQVYMSKNEEEYQLISAQKDGFGIFFAHAQKESSSLSIQSNENGTSISSSYSSSKSTFISTFEEIKA